MPTYDYQCQACGHDWELYQSMKDSPVTHCPKCKKKKAKRLLGLGAGIIFKGTGFYETDYKKKSGNEKKESSGDSGSSESKKPTDKSNSSSSESSSPKKDIKKSSGSKKEKIKPS
jgi:putative FmdB family regulatory protein